MKRFITSIQFLFLFIFFSSTSCPPERCEDAFELADLVLNSVEQIRMEEDDKVFYTILHDVLNTIEGIICDNAVDEAGTHKNKLPVVYSPDGNFDDNGQVVQVQTTTITQALAGGSSYRVESMVEFEVDGFYEIQGEIDSENDVQERDETNNTFETPLGRSSSQLSPAIVHVTHTGNAAPVRKDANGNPIYITSWTITVK